jgi:hypothetical protein
MQTIQTAADQLAALRTDDQRAAALRGVRPSELLDELAAELVRRGAADLAQIVAAEQDRRAEIRAENQAARDAAAELRAARDAVIATFERGMVVDLRGRLYELIEPRRTTNARVGWSVGSVRHGTWFEDNDTLADAMIASVNSVNREN